MLRRGRLRVRWRWQTTKRPVQASASAAALTTPSQVRWQTSLVDGRSNAVSLSKYVLKRRWVLSVGPLYIPVGTRLRWSTDSRPEHVSGVERQNFPLFAQLHLLVSRSPVCSSSDDLPLPLRLRSTWFFEPRSPLHPAHLTFWPTPLHSKAGFKGEVRAPDLPK